MYDSRAARFAGPAVMASDDCSALAPAVKAASSHRTSSRASVFHELSRSDVKLAIWQRRLPSAVKSALVAWVTPERTALDVHFQREIPDVSNALADLQDDFSREWLTNDVQRVAANLLECSPARRHRLTLSAVFTNQCRKFHVDRCPLRLITTYTGPGTEWVPDAVVRWDALDDSTPCPDRANRAIVADRRQVRHARPGDVLMMKGSDGFRRSLGQVHRSPPIEDLGVGRLVLVITSH
jgi:hypothetical protein